MSGHSLPINDSVEHEEQKKRESKPHNHVIIVSTEKLTDICGLDKMIEDATVQDKHLNPNKRLPNNIDEKDL